MKRNILQGLTARTAAFEKYKVRIDHSLNVPVCPRARHVKHLCALTLDMRGCTNAGSADACPTLNQYWINISCLLQLGFFLGKHHLFP